MFYRSMLSSLVPKLHFIYVWCQCVEKKKSLKQKDRKHLVSYLLTTKKINISVNVFIQRMEFHRDGLKLLFY